MEEHHAKGNHREWKAALETTQRHSEFFHFKHFGAFLHKNRWRNAPNIKKMDQSLHRFVQSKICDMPRYYRQSCQFSEKLISSPKCLIDIYIYHVFEVLKGHFTGRRAEQDHNGKQQSKTTDIQEWFLLFHNRPANQGNCFSNGTRPMINHPPLH